MSKNDHSTEADGTAALGICESLILALTDLKVLSERDARGLITDVSTSHEEAALNSENPEHHKAVMRAVQRILAGKNGVRRHRTAGQDNT